MMSVVSCKDEQNTIIFKNDIDNFAAWVDYSLPSKYYTDIAYSGKYVNLLNPSYPYSTTFHKKIGDITCNTISNVEVKAMVYCKDKIPPAFIRLDIWDFQSTSKFFLSSDIGDYVVKPNNWYLCKTIFNLNDIKNKKQEDFLRIYLKNDGTNDVYVDDITIQIYSN